MKLYEEAGGNRKNNSRESFSCKVKAVPNMFMF